MKKFIALILALFLTTINAGEFSKIDQEVRETIIETFDRDWENYNLGLIDYDNDIWNLKVTEYNTEFCLIEVSAYANLPSSWGPATHKVWVCINKDENGLYEGEVLDFDQF